MIEEILQFTNKSDIGWLEIENTIDINADNNLALLTATDSSFKSVSIKKQGTFTFKNNDNGYINTTVLNNQISSNSGVDNINLDSASTYAEYKSGDFNSITQAINENLTPKQKSELAYLNKLDISTTFYNPLDETHKSWDQTTRGLTQTSQLIIAVAAAAVTGGVGSFATMGAAALSAGAGSLATTAAISATNASMNTGGNFFGSLGHVASVTLKDTTSSDSLRSAAISAAAAGLAVGAGNAAGMDKLAKSANAVQNPALRVAANIGVSTARATINTASYIVADSVISGNSISETIDNDVDLKFLAAQIVGEAVAKEIGRAAHGQTQKVAITDSKGNVVRDLDGKVMTTTKTITPPTINQPQQLSLHAALGCAMGAMAGGDCGAGAAGGVAGEYLADAAVKNGYSPQSAILIGQGAGASTALIASMIQDKDDEKTARNIQMGSLIGANAAINNALLFAGKYKIPFTDDVKASDGRDYDLHIGVKGDVVTTSLNIGTDGHSKSFNIIPSVGGGLYFNVTAHGDRSLGSISYSPIPDIAFIEAIKTNAGYGFGGTVGIFVAPPVKVGVTVTPPEKNNH
jgi:hypothetical protein